MAKTKTNPKVDGFLKRSKLWQAEMAALREICLVCELTEELKWGKPCYSFAASNVVIIQGFKESCALLFCKGALLKDPRRFLEKPGENTQGARRIRFTQVKDIVKLAPVLKAFIREAMAAEEAGLQVEFKHNPEPVPEELEAKLADIPALRTAFESLTPGRQRAYILFISGAKQSSTRSTRVEKCVPKIINGKGLND